MSTHSKKYRTLIDLPMYPLGTIVTHEYQILPSLYSEGTYQTDGKWFTDERIGDTKVVAPLFLEALIKWCTNTKRLDCYGYVEEVEE